MSGSFERAGDGVVAPLAVAWQVIDRRVSPGASVPCGLAAEFLADVAERSA